MASSIISWINRHESSIATIQKRNVGETWSKRRVIKFFPFFLRNKSMMIHKKFRRCPSTKRNFGTFLSIDTVHPHDTLNRHDSLRHLFSTLQSIASDRSPLSSSSLAQATLKKFLYILVGDPIASPRTMTARSFFYAIFAVFFLSHSGSISFWCASR